MTSGPVAGRPLRLNADPQDAGRGLGQLVMVVLELLREVLERQAIRRMEGGGLTPAQIDDLGRALLEIRDSLARVRESLGVSPEEVEDAVTRAGQLLAAGDDRIRPPGAAGRTGPPADDWKAAARGPGLREKARTAP